MTTGNMPPDDIAGQNTSGMGSASVLPPELKAWNWGAFLTAPSKKFVWSCVHPSNFLSFYLVIQL